MNIFMNIFLRVVSNMNKKNFLVILLSAIMLVSCSVKNQGEVFASSEELLLDAQNNFYFKRKYKNKDIYITGAVEYIGVPKDNPSKKNTTYISIAEDDKTVVLVYFNFFVNNFIHVGDRVKVKCSFRKFSTPTFYYEGNFIEFSKGEIIEVLQNTE